MQGICIQAPDKSNLVVGETYYLYLHGGLAYHASRFPRPLSHFGTYQKKYFEIVAEVAVEVVNEWPPEPIQPAEPPQLEKGKVYEAELIWRRNANGATLGMYFITAIDNGYACKTDCYFYSDAALQRPKGRYPLHWFANIREYGGEVESIEHVGESEVVVVGDIVEIMDESLIRRKHYENGKRATVIENFYGCISIQLNNPVDKKTIGSVLLVGDELQSIKKVVSESVLKEADIPKMVRKKAETVNNPVKKQKYVQLSLWDDGGIL